MNRLTGADLAQAERGIATPFLLRIKADELAGSSNDHSNGMGETDLQIDRILRLLPGKRLVATSYWRGAPVIVKLFFHRTHWQRHLSREQAGNSALREAGIATPTTLLSTNTSDGAGGVLINKYLVDAQSIGELLLRNDSQTQLLTRKVLDLISRCHAHGIMQNDIHLDNFLVSRGEIYLLDGADVKTEVLGKNISALARLNNLALFFAQFPVTHDQYLEELVDYLDQQPIGSPSKLNLEEMVEQVALARDGRIENYTRKLTRNSTAHLVLKTNNQYMACKREYVSKQWREFVNNPDAFIDSGTMVKAGNSSTVTIVTIDGKRYLLKRYNIKGFVHGLRRMLGRSRALNSWRFAHILGMLGVSTATPLMMLEKRWLRWLRRECYFLCELIEGSTVAELMEDKNLPAGTQAAIFAEFTELFTAMEKSRISHGDLKASNFIHNEGKLYVLDLDAMARHSNPASFRKSFRKDLDRFARNWVGNIEYKAIAAQALQVTANFGDARLP